MNISIPGLDLSKLTEAQKVELIRIASANLKTTDGLRAARESMSEQTKALQEQARLKAQREQKERQEKLLANNLGRSLCILLNNAEVIGKPVATIRGQWDDFMSHLGISSDMRSNIRFEADAKQAKPRGSKVTGAKGQKGAK